MKKKQISELLLTFIFIISAVVLSSAAINAFTANTDNKSINIRSGIEDGLIAVSDFNSTDGLSISTGTSLWIEDKSTDYSEMKLVFSEYDKITDYLRQGDDERIYMSGTYDNTALIFYVKETEAPEHKLQIKFESIDEAMFFAGIESQAKATVRSVILINSEYSREALQLPDTNELINVNYKNCYYDAEKNAYQIIISVDNGMAAFDTLELTGLEILSIKGTKNDLFYKNGVLMQNKNVQADATEYVNFKEAENAMQATSVLPTQAYINLLRAFLQSVALQMQEIIDAFRLIYGQG